MNILIVTIKAINISNALKLREMFKDKHKITLITDKEELTLKKLKIIKPNYIFFPHWSWMIPNEIFQNFKCIVFHMTDLPFGRGGSPLQNLIVRNIEETRISAISVEENLDAGEIYLKENLNLNGTAEEILIRASNIIFSKMIPQFLNNQLKSEPQYGKIVKFKRRTKKDGEIKENFELQKIYDYIRMLDGEGYPNAYIKFGKFVLSFSRASIKNDRIIADVVIKEDEE